LASEFSAPENFSGAENYCVTIIFFGKAKKLRQRNN